MAAADNRATKTLRRYIGLCCGIASNRYATWLGPAGGSPMENVVFFRGTSACGAPDAGRCPPAARHRLRPWRPRTAALHGLLGGSARCRQPVARGGRRGHAVAPESAGQHAAGALPQTRHAKTASWLLDIDRRRRSRRRGRLGDRRRLRLHVVSRRARPCRWRPNPPSSDVPGGSLCGGRGQAARARRRGIERARSGTPAAQDRATPGHAPCCIRCHRGVTL